MDNRQKPPYTEWQVIPHGEDYAIFDSNFYGVNSGAQVAIIPGAKLLGRCVANTLEDDARMRDGLQRLAAFIAAAPELYAMVEKLADELYGVLAVFAGDGDEDFPLVDEARRLLAKARGEAQNNG